MKYAYLYLPIRHYCECRRTCIVSTLKRLLLIPLNKMRLKLKRKWTKRIVTGNILPESFRVKFPPTIGIGGAICDHRNPLFIYSYCVLHNYRANYQEACRFEPCPSLGFWWWWKYQTYQMNVENYYTKKVFKNKIYSLNTIQNICESIKRNIYYL